jgi:hypothetical protein
MSAGLETRKRLRLDGSSSEPKRNGVIAGVFKSDIFFKNEAEPHSGVEVDTRQAAALEQCLHSDSSLSAASSLLQVSILGTGETELVRGPDAVLVQPTPLFGVFLRTWFQPLAAELCSDMVVFGYAVTAIESKRGAISVPVRLHPQLCTVKVSTKNCRVSLIASGDFDDTITNPTVHTMFPPGLDGSIRSPAASSMDMCSLLSTFSSVAAEAARERADPVRTHSTDAVDSGAFSPTVCVFVLSDRVDPSQAWAHASLPELYFEKHALGLRITRPDGWRTRKRCISR